MTTAHAAKKTLVEGTWTTEQKQEKTATLFAATNMNVMKVLEKHGHDAIKEFQTAMNNQKHEYLTKAGVKTPIALVKHLAEFETNLFGSKIEITGDEHTASMTYLHCGMWEAMQKTCNMTEEKACEMGKGWEACLNETATKLGMKAKLEMGADKKMPTITFTK